jgi:hypothetical protein
MTRLAAQHDELLRAGLKLPSPSMVTSLLALLHRHMTGHALLCPPCSSVMRCACCVFPRGAHVRDDRWPWLLRCPARMGEKPPFFPWCYIPAPEELDSFMMGVMFTGNLQMLCDGSLEDHSAERWRKNPLLWCVRDGMFARDPWWERCGDEGVDKPRRRGSRLGEMVRGMLAQPIVVHVPGDLGRGWNSTRALQVGISGYGRRRRVVIESDIVGERVLLGFVIAMGQGAQRMQQSSWLQLEVCLGGKKCQPHDPDPDLLDMIVSMLPMCEKVALRGLDGVSRVVSCQMQPEEKGLLFKALALTGLDSATLERLNELPVL